MDQDVRHPGLVQTVAWSPSADRVATGSSDARVRIWETKAGGSVAHCVRHGGPVLSVAWSPSGSHVASGSEDYRVRVISACSGEVERVVGVFECVPRGALCNCACTPLGGIQSHHKKLAHSIVPRRNTPRTRDTLKQTLCLKCRHFNLIQYHDSYMILHVPQKFMHGL